MRDFIYFSERLERRYWSARHEGRLRRPPWLLGSRTLKGSAEIRPPLSPVGVHVEAVDSNLTLHQRHDRLRRALRRELLTLPTHKTMPSGECTIEFIADVQWGVMAFLSLGSMQHNVYNGDDWLQNVHVFWMEGNTLDGDPIIMLGNLKNLLDVDRVAVERAAESVSAGGLFPSSAEGLNYLVRSVNPDLRTDSTLESLNEEWEYIYQDETNVVGMAFEMSARAHRSSDYSPPIRGWMLGHGRVSCLAEVYASAPTATVLAQYAHLDFLPVGCQAIVGAPYSIYR